MIRKLVKEQIIPHKDSLDKNLQKQFLIKIYLNIPINEKKNIANK